VAAALQDMFLEIEFGVNDYVNPAPLFKAMEVGTQRFSSFTNQLLSQMEVNTTDEPGSFFYLVIEKLPVNNSNHLCFGSEICPTM
jgi:hypothetical protein